MLIEVAWIAQQFGTVFSVGQPGGCMVMFHHISLCCTTWDERFEASWLTSFHHVQSHHYYHI